MLRLSTQCVYVCDYSVNLSPSPGRQAESHRQNSNVCHIFSIRPRSSLSDDLFLLTVLSLASARVSWLRETCRGSGVSEGIIDHSLLRQRCMSGSPFITTNQVTMHCMPARQNNHLSLFALHAHWLGDVGCLHGRSGQVLLASSLSVTSDKLCVSTSYRRGDHPCSGSCFQSQSYILWQ